MRFRNAVSSVKRKPVITLTVVLIGAGLISYQNCSGTFKASASGSSQAASVLSGGGPTTGAPTTIPFNAGDAFEYSKVPYKSQQMQAYLATNSYPNSDAGAFSAIAIAKNGMGAMYFVGASESQATANLGALGGCAIMSREPCAVLAEGANFAIGSTDLETSFTYTLPQTTVIGIGMNPADPTVDNHAFYAAYGTSSSPKAMAVDQLGDPGVAFNVGGSYPVANSAEAQRMALEMCEMLSMAPPCTVFAVDDKIVFDTSKMNGAPVINFARKTVGGSIPGQTNSYLQMLLEKFYALSPTQPFSMAISPLGASGGQQGAPGTSTSALALSACNKNAGDQSCFAYSENLNVVMTPQNLDGYRTNKELFCLGAVRDSCASHRLMGCTDPGTYYVLQNNLPVLTQCN